MSNIFILDVTSLAVIRSMPCLPPEYCFWNASILSSIHHTFPGRSGCVLFFLAINARQGQRVDQHLFKRVLPSMIILEPLFFSQGILPCSLFYIPPEFSIWQGLSLCLPPQHLHYSPHIASFWMFMIRVHSGLQQSSVLPHPVLDYPLFIQLNVLWNPA